MSFFWFALSVFIHIARWRLSTISTSAPGGKCTLSIILFAHIERMIRPPPTQISISPRDLTWHIERHENRQALRASNCLEVIESPSSALPETAGNHQGNSTSLDDSPWAPSIKKSAFNTDSDLDSFSKDSVPRDPGNLRDGNLAEAGTPVGLKIQSVEKRPQIVEPSYNSQEMIRSSRASIQEDLRNTTEPSVDSLDMIHSEDLSYESEMVPHLRSHFSSESGRSSEDEMAPQSQSNFSSESGGPSESEMEPQLQSRFSSESGGSSEAEMEPQLRSRFSSESGGSTEADEAEQENRDANDLIEWSFTLPIRSSAILSNGERLDGTVNREDSPTNPYGSSRHLELDGTSDNEMDGPQMIDREAELDLIQYSAQTHGEGTGVHSNRRDSLDTPGSTRMNNESCDQLPSARLPPPPSVDNFRRRSSCLRRSQLHIAQAAASSSPEKQPEPSGGLINESSDESVLHNPGLLAQPPRRQSGRSHIGSSTLQTSQALPLDPPSTEDPLESSLYLQSSPSGSVNNNRQISTTSSPNPFLNSSPASSYRDISPYVLPRQRISSPTRSPPSLPPFPFSATPRTTSFNRVVTPISAISSPPSIPARSSIFAIYNDRLPASSQPQTPAHLPHNGVPAMSTQNPFGNGIGIQTEPPGRRSQRVRGVTPTRRGRAIEDQENVGVVVERGRTLTRVRARRGSNAIGPEQDWMQEDQPSEDFEGDV